MMKPKARVASKAKARAVALADECERLAKEAGDRYRLALTPQDKMAALEAQSIYNQMAANERATALRAEEISPATFTGRNRGSTELTAQRVQFLSDVARAAGTKSRDVIAAEAVGRDYAKQAKALWPGNPAGREAKILNFLRNNAKKIDLTFEG
jgi:hypothetical protein